MPECSKVYTYVGAVLTPYLGTIFALTTPYFGTVFTYNTRSYIYSRHVFTALVSITSVSTDSKFKGT